MFWVAIGRCLSSFCICLLTPKPIVIPWQGWPENFSQLGPLSVEEHKQISSLCSQSQNSRAAQAGSFIQWFCKRVFPGRICLNSKNKWACIPQQAVKENQPERPSIEPSVLLCYCPLFSPPADWGSAAELRGGPADPEMQLMNNSFSPSIQFNACISSGLAFPFILHLITTSSS